MSRPPKKTTSEPLSCRFCKRTSTVCEDAREEDGWEFFYVKCYQCDATGPGRHLEWSAISAWNTMMRRRAVASQARAEGKR